MPELPASVVSAAMASRVAVIGAGSWGTAVAAIAATNAPTVLWARREALAEQIAKEHENGDYLAGLPLPDALESTSDVRAAVDGADVVVMGVPSHGFRDVLERAAADARRRTCRSSASPRASSRKRCCG